MEIKNKKAYFDYEIIKEYEVGIELKGTEIKAIRNGSVSLKDSFARLKNEEVYVINMYIAKYEQGNIFNHEERRERKLLLHKKEIIKLQELSSKEGYTLIPIRAYLKKNLVKISVGVCRGKKNYDKRESIKERDLKRLEG